MTALALDVTGWTLALLKAQNLTVGFDGVTPPDLQSNLPFCAVQRTGGPDDGIVVDEATMAFHVYAATQGAANTTAGLIRATLMGLRGVRFQNATLVRPRTLSGPTWAYVEDQNLAHAVLLMQLRVKTV